MLDRRKKARALLDAWVEITAPGCRRRVTAADISVGGLGITLSGDPLAADARIVSEFPLPGIGLPLELPATVVWTDPPLGRAGLRFVDVDPGLSELLESFVAGRLAE